MKRREKTPQNIDYSQLQSAVSAAAIRSFRESHALTGSTARPGMIVLLVVGVGFGLLIARLLANGDVVSTTVSAVVFAAVAFVSMVLVLASIGYFDGRRIKRLVRLQRFAESNGADVTFDYKDPVEAGMIFDNGHSRILRERLVFSGSVEVGTYEYTTGSGKNKQIHVYGFAKMRLPRRLPHMVLDAKANNFFGISNLSDRFSGSQTLELEGDFNQHFTLYVPAHYERDALYIFTPDVMAAVLETGKPYDIEIIDDVLYAYSSTAFDMSSETALKRIFAVMDVIGAEVWDQTRSYADERIGDRSQDTIARDGQRLKSRTLWTGVGVVALIIAFQFMKVFFSSSLLASTAGIALFVTVLVIAIIAWYVRRDV